MTRMTPWFDSSTTCPDKPGLYETRNQVPWVTHAYWDGLVWRVPKGLEYYQSWMTIPGAYWRGFTEKQEA